MLPQRIKELVAEIEDYISAINEVLDVELIVQFSEDGTRALLSFYSTGLPSKHEPIVMAQDVSIEKLEIAMEGMRMGIAIYGMSTHGNRAIARDLEQRWIELRGKHGVT